MEIFQIYVHLHDSGCTHLCMPLGPVLPVFTPQSSSAPHHSSPSLPTAQFCLQHLPWSLMSTPFTASLVGRNGQRPWTSVLLSGVPTSLPCCHTRKKWLSTLILSIDTNEYEYIYVDPVLFSLKKKNTERTNAHFLLSCKALLPTPPSVYPLPTTLWGYTTFHHYDLRTTRLLPHTNIFPSSWQINQLRWKHYFIDTDVYVRLL